VKVNPDTGGSTARWRLTYRRWRISRVRTQLAISCLLGILLTLPALSDTREMDVSAGVVGGAGYLAGSSAKPPVLILHGFLQTRNFAAVSRMTEGLGELDYTVLTPTLSLGITRRRQSESCEALHLHELDDDVAELALWVEWLHRESGQAIVIIAHSAAAHTVTRFINDHPEAPVGRLIFISPSYLKGHPLGPEPPQRGAIAVYALGFCPHYATTPKAFRSYVDWSPEKMLDTLERWRERVSVIIGTGDERLSPHWIQALRDKAIDISNVEGANHFFASSHEFDLLEKVEHHLKVQSR